MRRVTWNEYSRFGWKCWMLNTVSLTVNLLLEWCQLYPSHYLFWMRRTKFYKMKSPLCEAYLSNIYLMVKLCKRPEVKNEPNYFLLCSFSSLGGMQLPLFWPASSRTLATSKVLDFLWPLEPNLLENNPSDTRNNEASN